MHFNAIVKRRNKTNGIHRIIDGNSNHVTNFKEMEIIVLKYYGDLVGTASCELLHMDIEVLQNGPQIHERYHTNLIQHVIEPEILQAMKIIGDMKAPGMDGFNTKFFKATRKIIRDDVMKVV